MSTCGCVLCCMWPGEHCVVATVVARHRLHVRLGCPRASCMANAPPPHHRLWVYSCACALFTSKCAPAAALTRLLPPWAQAEVRTLIATNMKDVSCKGAACWGCWGNAERGWETRIVGKRGTGFKSNPHVQGTALINMKDVSCEGAVRWQTRNGVSTSQNKTVWAHRGRHPIGGRRRRGGATNPSLSSVRMLQQKRGEERPATCRPACLPGVPAVP